MGGGEGEGEEEDDLIQQTLFHCDTMPNKLLLEGFDLFQP